MRCAGCSRVFVLCFLVVSFICFQPIIKRHLLGHQEGIIFTLYFDGSHNNQAEKVGAGCIITDDSGEVVVAAAYNLVGPGLSWCDEATAEVVGLRNGLRLAKERNVKLSVIKGDNQEVIDLVLGQGRAQPEPLTGIIAEIKRNLGFASLQRIDRAANKVAQKLASMGSLLVTGSRVFTKYDVPSQIVELINQEKARNADGEEDNRLAIDLCNVSMVATGAALLWGAISLGPCNVGIVVAALLWGAISLGPCNVGIVAAALLWGAISLASSLMRSLINNNAHYTLEYFGSDRNQHHKASAGCIIRNKRKFVVAAAYNLDDKYPNCHVAIAEAIALQNGLDLAKDNSVKLDLIHGRNGEVRSRVLGQDRMLPKNHELSVIIEEIKCGLCDQGIKPTDHNLKLVDEDTIKVARELAARGRLVGRKPEFYYSREYLPDKARDYFDAAFA